MGKPEIMELSQYLDEKDDIKCIVDKEYDFMVGQALDEILIEINVKENPCNTYYMAGDDWYYETNYFMNFLREYNNIVDKEKVYISVNGITECQKVVK